MTGKDLLLVVLVAGVAGAGAGIGASVAAPVAPDTSADLAARLDRIENALAKAAESEKEARESVAKLSDRITGLQMDVGGLRQASDERDEGVATAIADPARPGRAKRVVLRDGAQVLETSPGEHVLVGSDGVVRVSQTVPTFALGRQMTDEASAQLRAMSEGMRLRMLPEAERWKKAQEELHLTDAQVDGIKKAVADRDAAIKDAMQVETSGTAGNTRLTFRRMDAAKAATANQDFEKRMTDTLDADQEKTWKEKGYDHAFGGSGAGSRAVFLSASTIEMTTDDGKSGQK